MNTTNNTGPSDSGNNENPHLRITTRFFIAGDGKHPPDHPFKAAAHTIRLELVTWTFAPAGVFVAVKGFVVRHVWRAWISRASMGSMELTGVLVESSLASEKRRTNEALD